MKNTEIVINCTYKKTEEMQDRDRRGNLITRKITFFRTVYEMTTNLVCVGYDNNNLEWLTKRKFLEDYTLA